VTVPAEPDAAAADARHMARALELAARGDHRTRPNPKVGAVLVRDGAVLAEGWHAAAGGPHAEAAALAEMRRAGGDPAGATLYVTLEPCGPFPGKRTPPCVEAALAARLARVVVAQVDPHPAMRGRSLERLRAAGVDVVTGVREREARRLNGEFAKWAQAGQPYVTAKWAMSLDGRIAARTGDSRWISGEASRRLVHRLRGEVDAVLIGVGTALADDPRLTRRDAPGGDPLRVVLDSRGRLPPTSRLAATARAEPTLLLTTPAAPPERLAPLEAAGVEVAVLAARGGRVDPTAALEALAARGVRHVLLEGGAEVAAAFAAAGAVDRVWAFVAPKLIGGAAAPGPLGGEGPARVADALALEGLTARPVGEDVLLEGHLRVW